MKKQNGREMDDAFHFQNKERDHDTFYRRESWKETPLYDAYKRNQTWTDRQNKHLEGSEMMQEEIRSSILFNQFEHYPFDFVKNGSTQETSSGSGWSTSSLLDGNNAWDTFGMNWQSDAFENGVYGSHLSRCGFPPPNSREVVPVSSTVYPSKDVDSKQPIMKPAVPNNEAVDPVSTVDEKNFRMPIPPMAPPFIFATSYCFPPTLCQPATVADPQQINLGHGHVLSFDPSKFIPIYPAYPYVSSTGTYLNEHQMAMYPFHNSKTGGFYNKDSSQMTTPKKGTAPRSDSEDLDSASRTISQNKRGRTSDDFSNVDDLDKDQLSKNQAINSVEFERKKPKREVTARQSSKPKSGRTTFADLVQAELIRPGTQKWAVGHDPDVLVTVQPEGSILYKDVAYHSISSFALAVIRERNPHRRSCDGWKDVKIQGHKLESFRERFLRGCTDSQST